MSETPNDQHQEYVDAALDQAARELGITPLPWQRDWVAAALTGRPATLARGRNAGATTALRLLERAHRTEPGEQLRYIEWDEPARLADDTEAWAKANPSPRCTATSVQGYTCLHPAGHDGPHEARVIVVRWTDPTPEEPARD